jgi:hypothetical protein
MHWILYSIIANQGANLAMCNRKCVETLDISIAHKFAFLHSKGITLKANAQTDMIILMAE